MEKINLERSLFDMPKNRLPDSDIAYIAGVVDTGKQPTIGDVLAVCSSASMIKNYQESQGPLRNLTKERLDRFNSYLSTIGVYQENNAPSYSNNS